MGRLLIDNDYLRLIQNDNLLQIIEDNNQVKLDMEQSAQSEMIGYLSNRYVISEVFTDTTVFSNSAVYKAKNLVYLDAPAYNDTLNYVAGDLVLQSGIVYSSVSGNTPEPFDPPNWYALGAKNSFFYVSLPYSEYNNTTTYSPGDNVWYKDSVYTCVVSCVGILPTSSTAFWGTGTLYTVTAVLPTDNTKWSQGDSRNQQIVLYLLDITLYHLHSRINPRNIPDLRKERYDGNGPNQVGGAIGWLKKVNSGDVTADLPNISPQQGVSISWGVSEGLNSNGTYSVSRNTMW